MKQFNLEEALAGNYCVTRNGYKAKITQYAPKYNDDLVFGFVKYKNYWAAHTWGIDGSIDTDGDHDLDLVGMWEKLQPEVTITLSAPLKNVKEGQEIWYVDYDIIVVHGINFCDTYPEKGVFTRNSTNFIHLLESGQLFNTKEDAQAWLDVMRGARR